MLELLIRGINGGVTLFISLLLFRLYRNKEQRFYLFWSSGFLFYGLNIILRLYVPTIELDPLGLLAFGLNVVGFILIMTGIGELVNTAKLTSVITVLLQFLLLIILLITNSEYIAWLSLLIPYMIIISSLGYVYFYLKLDIIWILAGWIIIFLSNLALAWESFTPAWVDFFSAAAKFVVYRGMSQPTFSVLADGLRRFVLGGIPTEYPEKYNGGLYLVNFRSAGREKEVQWIKNRIIENNLKGIRTVFISFFDLITPRDLFDKKTEGNFYFIRVLPGRRESAKLFESQITAISDDPNQIHLAFSDIIKTSQDTTVPVEVIVYTLSNAIIAHGWRRIYTMMTSLIPSLKENKVRVTYIYHQDVYEDKTVATKFEMLAEKILRE